MSHNLVVQVLDSDGDPISGTEVTIEIEGIIKGGRLRERTNDDGFAEFETAEDYRDSTEVKIRVRDEWYGPYEIGGGSYTVQLE